MILEPFLEQCRGVDVYGIFRKYTTIRYGNFFFDGK